MTTQQPFWPGSARLAVSFSLMFEGGGQPISGAGGVSGLPGSADRGADERTARWKEDLSWTLI